jgi:hypothetical protein
MIYSFIYLYMVSSHWACTFCLCPLNDQSCPFDLYMEWFLDKDQIILTYLFTNAHLNHRGITLLLWCWLNKLYYAVLMDSLPLSYDLMYMHFWMRPRSLAPFSNFVQFRTSMPLSKWLRCCILLHTQQTSHGLLFVCFLSVFYCL